MFLGYGAGSGYGGQGAYGQFGQAAYATGREGVGGYYGAQQSGTANQQQMSYGQDNSAYTRTGYSSADGYSSGAHSSSGYSYDNQGAAAFQQQYTDSQGAGWVRGKITIYRTGGDVLAIVPSFRYGRGMTQQRGVSSAYQQPYGGSHWTHTEETWTVFVFFLSTS